MSREIKFRAWHPTQGMTMAPVLSTSSYTGKVICTGYDKDLHEVTLHLMQYTGLKDKNGVDIYDSDLLKVDGSGVCECVICPINGVVFESVKDDMQNTTAHDCAMEQDEYVVIGNVHQNPELLK